MKSNDKTIMTKRIQYKLIDVESLLQYICENYYQENKQILEVYEKMCLTYNEEFNEFINTLKDDPSILYTDGEPGSLRHLIRNVINEKGSIKVQNYKDEGVNKLMWFLWTLIYTALNRGSLSLFEYKIGTIVRNDKVVLIELRYISDDDPVEISEGEIEQVFMKKMEDFSESEE